MSKSPRFYRRARWAVPAGAIAAVGLVAGGTLISAAQAAPALPPRSAAQLLAGVAKAAQRAPRPMTATITQSAALGLPSLPDLGGVSSTLSALSGTHTVKVWYGGPAQLRLAETVAMGETDLRLNGQRAWLWQSSSQTATRLILPARDAAGQLAPGWTGAPDGAAGAPDGAATTVQQAVRQVLAAVGPTTAVSVQQNVTVAGQPAYQLLVQPRNHRSLIGRIAIDIDASNSMPLQLQVFARGAASPAFSLGYSALSFGRPAASNFTFSPPPGAKVKTVTVPVPSAPPARAKLRHRAPRAVSPVSVVGHGWLSVAVLPASSAIAALTGQLAGQRSGWVATAGSASKPLVSDTSRSGNAAAYSSTLTVSGPAAALSGPDGAALGLLLKAATHVHGAWGSGRLLRTSLVSVLLTSKGELLAGAVTPAVLYADVAPVK